MLCIRVELDFPCSGFLIVLGWVSSNKFLIFYFIFIGMLSLNFGSSYGFENNDAYYRPRGLYVNLSLSAALAYRIIGS